MKVILDGMSEVYRSYYSIKLSNSKGVPTGAVYGFLKTIVDYSDYFGSKLVIAWEGGNLIRKEIYPQYKEGRGERIESVCIQTDLIQKLMSLLGVSQYFAARREADDIMYTFAERYKKEGTVFVVTMDSDLFQVVDDNVFIYNLRLKKKFSRVEVFEKMNVSPSKIVLLKSILGDSSDNIIGIKRLPYKIICNCVEAYSSVDEIIEDRLGIAEKVKQKLIDNIDIVKKNQQLVQLCDVSNEMVEVPIEKNMEAVNKMLYELEFESYILKNKDKIDKFYSIS